MAHNLVQNFRILLQFIYLLQTFQGYLSPYRHSSLSALETEWHRSGLITEDHLEGCVPKATIKTWNIKPTHQNPRRSYEVVVSFSPNSWAASQGLGFYWAQVLEQKKMSLGPSWLHCQGQIELSTCRALNTSALPLFYSPEAPRTLCSAVTSHQSERTILWASRGLACFISQNLFN